MDKIRQPQQERSNEKKNKIIQASYEIFSKIGYYSANTSQIAKRAGVSTGIIYSYFKDKRDILLYILKIYIDKVTKPLISFIQKIKTPINYENLISDLIDLTIKTHKENSHLHNTLHALAVSDEDVNTEFESLEYKITENISEKLESVGVKVDNLKEKVHISMNSIQSYAHEFVYSKHDYIDYEAMRKIVVKNVVSLFE